MHGKGDVMRKKVQKWRTREGDGSRKRVVEFYYIYVEQCKLILFYIENFVDYGFGGIIFNVSLL